MPLTLAIENHPQLPDGGPTSIQISGRRGIDIGRDQHLDWTLPDPDRVISGKHCEIRYYEGAFWLHDLSRNGTFVNGSDRRLHEPHRLRNGDRLEIGNYIIGVRLDGPEAEPPPAEPTPAQAVSTFEDIWDDAGEAPPPIPSTDLRVPKEKARAGADFLDWVVDLPEATPDEPSFRPPPADLAPTPIGADAGRQNDTWGPVRRAASSGSAQPSAARFPNGVGTAELESAVQLPVTSVGVPVSASDQDILRRFARGAGVPPEVLAGRNAGEVAEEFGVVMRIVVENLRQLLAARAESRRMLRGSRQTMIQALDNNPIKFSPTAEDALRAMLGPRTKGYLNAQQTLEQSFEDLKSHQLATFIAMQKAVEQMMRPFDPKAIEDATPQRGLGVIGSRKAALWDAFVARWEAALAEHDNGFIDAFVSYFSQYYQRGERDS